MKFAFFGIILLHTSLFATFYYHIDTAKPLECIFSHTHHNRVLLNEGRIQKVIYPEDKILVHMEEVSGQAFIQARQKNLSETVLSVITQDGDVQDLIINFTSAPGEVVILQYPKEKAPCTSAQRKERRCERIKYLANLIMNDRTPDEYLNIRCPKKLARLRSGLKMTQIGELQGCDEILKIVEIKNTSFRKKCLSEQDFTCHHSLWVYVDKYLLKSKGTTRAIIAVKL